LFGDENGQQPVDVPVIPVVPLIPVVPVVGHGIVVVAVAGDETVGIVGTTAAEVRGGTAVIIGTAAAELTPRLPISKDPNGIPVRAPPPGVVEDVDVGVDDAAMLLEPEPHMPDMPEVCIIPEVVDIPDVAEIDDDVDNPEEVDIPEVAAVAGAAVPAATPPPSKLAVDPNMDDGEVPMVEHDVPPPGAAIVPVTMGAGLTPGDAISVDPRGMPVGETVEPVPKPSGDVAPMLGVGLAIPLTCAMAGLQRASAGRTAAINENLMGLLLLQPASARPEPVDGAERIVAVPVVAAARPGASCGRV
jgi:hypothetical protein